MRRRHISIARWRGGTHARQVAIARFVTRRRLRLIAFRRVTVLGARRRALLLAALLPLALAVACTDAAKAPAEAAMKAAETALGDLKGEVLKLAPDQVKKAQDAFGGHDREVRRLHDRMNAEHRRQADVDVDVGGLVLDRRSKNVIEKAHRFTSI